jgi:hypothetical protein
MMEAESTCWNAGKIVPDYTARYATDIMFVLNAVKHWNLKNVWEHKSSKN